VSGEYAGESIAKKVVRARTYLRAKEMLHAAGRTDNLTVVVLPGPDAAEVGCLRHILKPKHIFAVDRDQSCVDHFFDKSDPMLDDDYEILTQGYTGELEDFNPECGIDFANLDLMGNINGDPGETASLVTNWLNMWGVASITYLRGREKGEIRDYVTNTPKGLLTSRMTRQTRRRWGPDPIRSSAIFGSLQRGMHRRLVEGTALKYGLEDNFRDPKILDWAAAESALYLRDRDGIHFTPIASYSYQANTPMGVLVAQLINEKKERSGWEKLLNGKANKFGIKDRRLISGAIPKDPMVELLREADFLAKEGYSTSAVADIFDVSTGTMAAWKAHRTMGTYSA
jgi:hypothetical protein